MTRAIKAVGRFIWHGFMFYGAEIAASYGDPTELQDMLRGEE